MGTRRVKHVEIDRQLCVGSSMCVGADPEAFAVDPAGKAVFQGRPIASEEAELAAEMCPVSAITIVYEDEADGDR